MGDKKQSPFIPGVRSDWRIQGQQIFFLTNDNDGELCRRLKQNLNLKKEIGTLLLSSLSLFLLLRLKNFCPKDNNGPTTKLRDSGGKSPWRIQSSLGLVARGGQAVVRSVSHGDL